LESFSWESEWHTTTPSSLPCDCLSLRDIDDPASRVEGFGSIWTLERSEWSQQTPYKKYAHGFSPQPNRIFDIRIELDWFPIEYRYYALPERNEGSIYTFTVNRTRNQIISNGNSCKFSATTIESNNHESHITNGYQNRIPLSSPEFERLPAFAVWTRLLSVTFR